MIQEAIELWCEGEDVSLPEPTALDQLVKNPEYAGGVWLLIDVDTARLETRAVRLNISLPQGLLAQIDSYAKSHGVSRSGFLAQAARQAMQS